MGRMPIYKLKFVSHKEEIMRKAASNTILKSSLAIIIAGMALVSASAIASSVEEGKKLAFDRKQGNCLACHMIEGGISPGDIGPPLIAMKARFPDRAKLRAQIYDATVANPESIMIPFGRHKALSDAQIDSIIDYMYTL
jgi:sulfur-oxidizing protein SoxX